MSDTDNLIDAKTVNHLLTQAIKYSHKREFSQCSKLLNNVLKIEPNNITALDLFGFVKYFQNIPTEAEQYCLLALAINPNHVYALKGLGLCLAAQGQIRNGVKCLQKAILLQPDYFDSYWDLAVIFTKNKQYTQALEIIEQGKIAVSDKSKQLDSFARQLKTKQQIK